MNPHVEVLPAEQQRALLALGTAAAVWGCYLGGGTAVAIHLGHRRSVDLDWFTSERLENPLELAQDLQRRGVDLRVNSVPRGSLLAEVSGVRVSFFEFGYPLLETPWIWPTFDCPLALLADLAAMKLLAVEQRGTKKDFVDLYALGEQRFSLGQMLGLYQQKFSIADTARLRYSLCYFDDAEDEPMPDMLWDVSWAHEEDAPGLGQVVVTRFCRLHSAVTLRVRHVAHRGTAWSEEQFASAFRRATVGIRDPGLRLARISATPRRRCRSRGRSLS